MLAEVGVGVAEAEGLMGVAAAKASQLAPRRMSFMANSSIASNWGGQQKESPWLGYTARELADLCIVPQR